VRRTWCASDSAHDAISRCTFFLDFTSLGPSPHPYAEACRPSASRGLIVPLISARIGRGSSTSVLRSGARAIADAVSDLAPTLGTLLLRCGGGAVGGSGRESSVRVRIGDRRVRGETWPDGCATGAGGGPLPGPLMAPQAPPARSSPPAGESMPAPPPAFRAQSEGGAPPRFSRRFSRPRGGCFASPPVASPPPRGRNCWSASPTPRQQAHSPTCRG
jgi:hypothetical protein